MSPVAASKSRTKQRTQPASAVRAPLRPTEEQIRARAYQIYLSHGGKSGSPEADWHQAELELSARLTLLGRP